MIVFCVCLKKMGIWDVIKKAGNAAAGAITNPISTAKHIVTAPVKMVNRIVDTANSLDEMPSKIVELLASGISQPPEQIVAITIFREPVNALVVGAAKVLTLGKLQTKVRHVFEVFEIVNKTYGSRTFVRMEKNEIVEYKIISEDQFNSLKRSHESLEVRPTVKDGPSLKLFFDNYVQRTNPKTLWLYDPITANCQVFVYLGLVANESFFKMTPTIETFIVQSNVKNEVKGISKDVMKGITTVANFGRRFIGRASGSFFGDVCDPLHSLEQILHSENSDLATLLNAHAELVMKWVCLGNKIEKILKTEIQERGRTEETRQKRERE